MTLRMLFQYLLRTCHLVGNDALRLLINHLCRLIGIGFGETVVISTGGVIEAHVFQLITHTVESYHRIGLFGSPLQVIECSGRILTQEELFCRTTA